MKYANLLKAADTMARCCGVDLFEHYEFEKFVEQFVPEVLQDTDAWLAKLTYAQTELWVNGDTVEMARLAATTGAPHGADSITNKMYEALCD